MLIPILCRGTFCVFILASVCLICLMASVSIAVFSILGVWLLTWFPDKRPANHGNGLQVMRGITMSIPRANMQLYNLRLRYLVKGCGLAIVLVLTAGAGLESQNASRTNNTNLNLSN